MALFAGICKAAVEFLDDSAPSARVGLTVLTINYVILATLAGLAVPKWLHLRRAAGSEEEPPAQGGDRSKMASKLTVPLPSTAAARARRVNGVGGIGNGGGGANGGNSSGLSETSSPSQPTPASITPAGLYVGHFQTLCNKTENALSNMSPTDRQTHIDTLTTLASTFLATLSTLVKDAPKEKIDAPSPNCVDAPPGTLLRPMPRPPIPTSRSPSTVAAIGGPLPSPRLTAIAPRRNTATRSQTMNVEQRIDEKRYSNTSSLLAPTPTPTSPYRSPREEVELQPTSPSIMPLPPAAAEVEDVRLHVDGSTRLTNPAPAAAVTPPVDASIDPNLIMNPAATEIYDFGGSEEDSDPDED